MKLLSAVAFFLLNAIAVPGALPFPPKDAQKVPLFGRWEKFFDVSGEIGRVVFTSPDGKSQERPVFKHQPVRFEYDRHGYETIASDGEIVLAVRFVPDQTGIWKWKALKANSMVEEGTFECVASSNPGYIEVSPDDPRYFRFSSGKPFVAIGLNLCCPPSVRLSAGSEFKTLNTQATLGCRDYERWFSRLHEAGGNFARIWVGDPYFNPEEEMAGELSLEKFGRLDAVVELARKYDIHLKLCLEHFRAVKPKAGMDFACRKIRNPATGREPESMDEWFQEAQWQELWFKKVNALTARYGNDPVIMAWELWNEIDCCSTSGWKVQLEWTRATLPKIKGLCPRNLVVNSLGSFDNEKKIVLQNDFKMDEMDFQQVHRYLDQGAGIPLCREDPVGFSVDAVQKARRPDRPVILAETGAVNDNHSGPFRYYRWDDEGIILHDVVYPAFFAGAAGSGQIWHWDVYVDNKNLWESYRALSDILKDVQTDREHFEPLDFSTPDARVLILRGRNSILGWIRNREDTWLNVLRDGKRTAPVENFTLDLAALNLPSNRQAVEIFRPWPNDARGNSRPTGEKIVFPAFVHGLLFRIRLNSPGTQGL